MSVKAKIFLSGIIALLGAAAWIVWYLAVGFQRKIDLLLHGALTWDQVLAVDFLVPAWVCLSAGIAVAKVVLLLILRPTGLANPDHYHLLLLLSPPWRPLYRRWLRVKRWSAQFSYGKARSGWAGALATLCRLYKPGQLYLGRFWACGLGWFQPIGLDCKLHAMMFAKTGSGKTTLLITLLSLWCGNGRNSFTIDPKGTITRVLKRRLSDGGEGIRGAYGLLSVFDPKGIIEPEILPKNSPHRGAWNLYDEADWVAQQFGQETVVSFMAYVTTALIVPETGGNPFFPASARGFSLGLLLWVFVQKDPSKRNLIYFRQLLAAGDIENTLPGQDPFSVLLQQMVKCQEFGGIVARAAYALAGSSDRSRADTLATCRTYTNWLDFPEIQAISQRSTIHLYNQKHGHQNVLLTADLSDIRGSLSPWLRLMTMVQLRMFELVPGAPKHPCLIICDECQSLQKIDAFEVGAAALREYGALNLLIFQDLEGLQRVYPESWKGLIGSTEAIWWMGSDPHTADYLESILGESTSNERVDGGMFSDVHARYQQVERPLMTRNQIMEFLRPNPNGASNIIVTLGGGAERPLRLRNGGYFRELSVPQYDADPKHGDNFLRGLTRRLYRWRATPSEQNAPPNMGPGQAELSQ